MAAKVEWARTAPSSVARMAEEVLESMAGQVITAESSTSRLPGTGLGLLRSYTPFTSVLLQRTETP